MRSGNKVILWMLIMSLTLGSLPMGIADAATARFAKISELKGKVTVQKNGGVKVFNAFKGMSLSEGDRIETASGASAILEVDKSRTIKLGDNTRIDVTELKGSIGNLKSSTKLLNGKIFVVIDKKLGSNEKFEISTPTAVMGVRGTKFYVVYENGVTRVGVLEGVVAVSFAEVHPNGLKWLPEILVNRWQEAVREKDASIDPETYIRPLDINDLDIFVLRELLKYSDILNADTISAIEAAIEKKEPLEEERLKDEQQQEELNDSGVNERPIYEGDPDPDRKDPDPSGQEFNPVGGNPFTG